MRSFFTNYEMELAGQGVPGLSQPTAVRVSPAVIKLISQPSSQWHLMIYTDPQLLDKLSQWREESGWKSIKLIINSNDKVIVNIHTQETCRRQLIIMHNWECWWFIYFEITPHQSRVCLISVSELIFLIFLQGRTRMCFSLVISSRRWIIFCFGQIINCNQRRIATSRNLAWQQS